jgi:hypothetical protein
MLRKLFIGLLLLSIGAVALALATELPNDQKYDKAQKAQYPPYPDVWDWQVPKGDMPIDDGDAVRVKRMDNGDIMIAYKPEKKDAEYRYVSFFGKNIVSYPEAVYKGDYTSDVKYRIPFKDDYFLKTTGGGMRSDGCDDMLGYYIDVYDKGERTSLKSKRLLYVFDKPKYYKTIPYCMDGQSFYYQVKAVDAKFLPLKDGTFLLIASEGYIIRFDENFQTKSKLMNTKFYWMDTNDLEVFKANAPRKIVTKHDNKSVIDIIDLKRLYSDLYQLLMKKKGGNK